MMDTDCIISFWKEAAKHHLVLRQIWCSDHQRQESDSEHAWHTALFLMLLEKEYPQLDMRRMLKMAILHDMAEIYAGDNWVLDKKGRVGKKEREQTAWKQLLAQLPPNLTTDWHSIVQEYEEKKTPEAKLVNACDKLQPLIMNLLSDGQSWKKFNVSFADIHGVKIQHVQHDKFLMKIYETLMHEAKERKLLH